jgi:hypothetical protein
LFLKEDVMSVFDRLVVRCMAPARSDGSLGSGYPRRGVELIVGGTGDWSFDALGELCRAARDELRGLPFVASVKLDPSFDPHQVLLVLNFAKELSDVQLDQLKSMTRPQLTNRAVQLGGVVDRDHKHYTGTTFTLAVSDLGWPIPASAVAEVRDMAGVSGVRRGDRWNLHFTVIEPDEDKARVIAAAVAKALRLDVPFEIEIIETDPAAASNPHYNQFPDAASAARAPEEAPVGDAAAAPATRGGV